MALINENDEASARDSLGGLTKVVLNFLALRGVTGPSLANTITVQYGVTFQDGLGGVFIWNPTDASSDNGSTIIKPYSNAVGRWNLLLAQGQAPAGLLAGLGQGVRSVSSDTTVGSADRGFVLSVTGATTVHMPSVASVGAGFIVAITRAVAIGSTSMTIDSGLFYMPSNVGVSSLSLQPGESVILMAIGGNVWFVIGGSGYTTQAASQVNTVVALTDAAFIATPAASGGIFDVTLAASRTMAAPTAPRDGQAIRYRITQGGAGTNLITWNAVFDFGTAGAPVLSTAVGKTDIVAGIYNAAAAKWQMIPATFGFN